MRRGKKIVLSVLLTAAMLCGMLTPAFGWFVQPCRLRTPDGTFWVDVREIEYGQWTRPSDYSTTVWSQDNEVWYTTQGLAQYLQIAVVPDESWYSCTLTPEFVSPDGGQLWLCGSRRYQWQSWYDVWRYSNNEPSILYRSNDSFLMTTTPLGDDTYTVYVYDLLTDEYENGISYCSFNVRSDPWCGVFLSTRKNLGNSWTTSLGNADWREETAYVTGDPGYLSDPANPLYTNNYCDVLNPGATFNPWQRRLNTVEFDGAAFRFTDMAHVITPMGQSDPVKQHTLFLRAARECTVRLELSCIAQASVYGMVDLSYLRMIPASDSPLVSVSSTGSAYAAAPYGPNTQDNFLLLNGTGEPYTPVNFMGGSAEVLDSNYNGIIDEFDTLGSVTLDQTVYSSPAAEIVLHLTPYNTIELPFFFWSEGQCAQAVGAVVNTDARFEVLIETLDDDQSQFEYPFEYTETEDSVTITGLSTMYLANDPNNYYYTSVYDTTRIVGLSFDPETGTLTLPSEIAGKPVTALGQFSLLEATDPMFVFDDVQLTKYDVQQIILPNTIETVGENVIDPSVERVHVPFDAVISPYSFMAQYQPLTICCDAPNSLAQQTIETAGFGQQYTFVVCTEHGTSHTHDFGDWTVTTEPTCTAAGEKTRTCSGCGTEETETVDALGHDFSIAVVTEATCTTDGYTTYKCSRCDEEYIDEDSYIDALGHDFGEWTVTTPPTHDAEGEETRECARCHVTESRSVGRLVDDPRFTVSSVPARPGKMVQVQLSVEDNPGVVGAKFALTYDPQILTLTGVENGDVFGADAFQPGGNYADVPFTVFWLDALSQENYTADGVLATFTFAVAADAPGGVTPITVTFEQDSTFDAAMQPVAFSVTNGGVEVFERMAGDADGDAKTTLQDVTNLARYLAGGWGVEVDVSSADVDGDGKLTLRDLTILRRYLAGWDVVLV